MINSRTKIGKGRVVWLSWKRRILLPVQAAKASIGCGVQRLWIATLSILAALSLVLGGVIISTFDAGRQRNEAERRYIHTLDVLVLTAELKATLQAALRGERGYLLTRDTTFTKPLNNAEVQAPVLLDRLSRLTIENKRQQRVLRSLVPQTRSFLTHLRTSVQGEDFGASSPYGLTSRPYETRREIEQLLRLIGSFESEERSLLATRQIISRQAEKALLFNRKLLALTGVILLLAAAIATVVALRAYSRAILSSAELQRLSITDELTGLRNRRSFMNALQSEIARAATAGAPLCLVLLDVDHFKRVNDQHGHPGGDAVLREVAQVLRRSIRGGDALARFGGEEFAVIMPGANFVQCELACERMRQSLAGRPIQLPSGQTIAVTISSGAAVASPGETEDSLIRRADEALYRAKAAGRNRVMLAA